VLVPGLIAVLALGQREAAANSLVAIIPIAVAGAATYYFLGAKHQLRVDLALVLAAGSIAGAVAGARLSHGVSERALRLAFGVLMIASAIRLLIPGV